MSTFAEGVMAGLIAAVLFAVVSSAFSQVLLPYIRQQLSDTPDVSGSWSLYYSHSEVDQPAGQVRIHQRFSRIRAKAYTVVSRHGARERMEYSVVGTFSSGVLAFVYHNVGLKGYVSGVGILRLSHNGRALIGKVAYIGNSTQAVDAYEFALRRI